MTKETVYIVVMILFYYFAQVFDQELSTCSTYSCYEEILHGLRLYFQLVLCIIYIKAHNLIF